MSINLKKTSVVKLGTRQNLLHADNHQIFIKTEITEYVEHQNLLGVIIDGALTWNKQIDAVSINISRRLTFLKLLSKYVNENSLNQYYNSYILPIFYYGCLVWGRCTVSKIDRLLKIKTRATRITLNADINDSVRTNVF